MEKFDNIKGMGLCVIIKIKIMRTRQQPENAYDDIFCMITLNFILLLLFKLWYINKRMQTITHALTVTCENRFAFSKTRYINGILLLVNNKVLR